MTRASHPARTRIGAAALLALFTAACFSERGETTGPQDGNCASPVLHATVQIRDFDFSPATVCLTPGGTVTWVNAGAEIHTSTSSADPRAWDSGFLSNGQQFSHTFEAAGSFEYHCLPHPFMTGVVTVR